MYFSVCVCDLSDRSDAIADRKCGVVEHPRYRVMETGAGGELTVCAVGGIFPVLLCAQDTNIKASIQIGGFDDG